MDKPSRRQASEDFAGRLKELIYFYDVSPHELGDYSFVDPSEIISWLGGKPPRNGADLERVAEALGVSSIYLLSGVETI